MSPQELEQQTDEWLSVRCGRVTASRFKDVITEPRTKAAKEAGELSATAWSYLLEKLAETLTGRPVDGVRVPAMQWGLDFEPHARAVYEEVTGHAVEQLGFFTLASDDRIGGSPDGLVGDNGGLEIKCPANPTVHLNTQRPRFPLPIPTMNGWS